MRVTLLMVLACTSIASAQTTQPSADGWRPLLNGKDLAGWYPYLQGESKGSDAKHVFTVEGTAVHLYADPAASGPMGYLATDESFGDYRLRFQYKWGRAKPGAKPLSRNAGLLYHITGADGARPGVVWPYCIQCQVAERRTGEMIGLGVSITSTIDPARKQTPTYKEGGEPYATPAGAKEQGRITVAEPADVEDEWNAVELIVRGDSAEHIVNGKLVGRLTGAKAPDIAAATQPHSGPPPGLQPMTRGRIGLQAEGYEITYRNIEIRPLRPGE